MSTGKSQRQPTDQHELWSEALWGLGLIGGVLVAVALVARTFGR
jgi:hypothetical protein